MPRRRRREAPAPSVRPGYQGQPPLQHAPGKGRHLRRRAPGLYRPRPRPDKERRHRLDGKERMGGVMASIFAPLPSWEGEGLSPLPLTLTIPFLAQWAPPSPELGEGLWGISSPKG